MVDITGIIRHNKWNGRSSVTIPHWCDLQPGERVKITRCTEQEKPKKQPPTPAYDIPFTPGQTYALRDVENLLELCEYPRTAARSVINKYLKAGKLTAVDGGYRLKE